MAENNRQRVDQPGSGALKPVGGGGRAFLGVRRMTPQDDGVHLSDDAGAEIAVIAYGERVYINGRVMSFAAPPLTTNH